MLNEQWGSFEDERDFGAESTPSNVRLMDETQQKGLLFDAIRGRISLQECFIIICFIFCCSVSYSCHQKHLVG